MDLNIFVTKKFMRDTTSMKLKVIFFSTFSIVLIFSLSELIIGPLFLYIYRAEEYKEMWAYV
jgi:hypothetical protein